jgi:glycosyltransferase involved in cell wall biosynthesis
MAEADASGSPLTAVVLTFNEEVHIDRCLARLKPLGARLVVIDSFSTDRTLEIARGHGADIFQNPFTNQAAQFEWGVRAAAIDSGWVLRVDADEFLEPSLIQEIRERLPTVAPEVGAIAFARKVYFQGKWIRWGGFYPTVLTRLWRAGAAHIEQRWMDEHVVVEKGETIRFGRGDLVDDNLKDITDWTAKHNSYTTRQMVEWISQEYPQLALASAGAGLNAHARRKRFLRNGLYGRAPLYLRAILYFLQRYLLRLGFLDGRRGFIFHTLQGFWNFFLVDVKVGEARRLIAAQGVEAFRAHLAERHNIQLPPPSA